MAVTSTMLPAVFDSFAAQGFFILDGFAPAEVGDQLLDDVISVVREADESGITPAGMFVAPESQGNRSGSTQLPGQGDR